MENRIRQLEDEGEALLRANRHDAAIAKFDQALAIEPRSRRSLRGKIIGLRKGRRFEEATALINEALSYYPSDACFLVERGWLAFDRTDYRDAIERFDETLRADHQDEGALQGKAAALRLLRNFTSAQSLLARAISIHPESAGLLAERGWLWRDQNNYPNAANAFAAALKVKQPDDSIYLWQLFILRELKRLDEAKAVLQQALERFPYSLRLKAEMGWQLFYREDFTAAAEQFASVLAIEPTLPTALQGRIASLRLAGALADAEYELERNAEAIASHPGLIGEKAWTAFAREDFSAAARAFRAIVDSPAGNHLDKVNLAWALASKGDQASLREAAGLCREALSNTKSAQALGCLGVVSFRQKKIGDAEKYLKESIRVDPLLGHHADLAALYTFMLRYDEAEKILQEGMAIKPYDIPLHLEGASLHLLRKRPEMAVDCYRRALRINPKNLDAVKGVALALLAAGRTIEAESAVREGLPWATGARRAALLLVLARALAARFDETADQDLLGQALQAISQYRQLSWATAESFFQEGVVQSKLGRYREAHSAFVKCQQLDGSWGQAGVNAAHVKLLISKEQKGIRFGEAKSWVLFFLFSFQLLALWFLRVQGNQFVSDTMMTVLVPICLGLMIVAFLMPALTKFSVTGIAVELAEAPSVTEPKGPRGELHAAAALPMTSPAI